MSSSHSLSTATVASSNSSQSESAHLLDVSMHFMEADQDDDKSLEHGVIKELRNNFRAIKDREKFPIQALGCNLLLHVVRIQTESLRNTSPGHDFWHLRMSHQQLDDLKASLMRSHLVDILVFAMQNFAQHALIQTHALSVLAKLVNPRLFTDTQEVHVHIVTAICMHMARPKIVTSILSLLFSLCKQQHFGFCRALVDQGIFAVMKTVMHIHDEHVDITSLSCQLMRFLVNMCVVANYESASMLDCIKPVLKVLVSCRSTVTESTNLMAVCGILWHLAKGSGEAKRHLVMKTKTVSCLVRLLLQHSRNRDLMAMVCGTCYALSMSDDLRVLSKLSRCWLVDALGPICYRYQDDELVIEPVLITLIRLTTFMAA
ncbi:hypothetical protein MPSEU_000980000 [Mayamaea pseudoterrestris]|nr:hypothetical protein MPSEU_000980000 [Mayamaea pseudoterrestris]